MKPLKAVPLHPSRSLPQESRVKIKRCPHSHHRHPQQVPHLISEHLLPRTPQAHKYDLGTACPYLLRKLKLFFWGKGSEFRRQDSGYL